MLAGRSDTTLITSSPNQIIAPMMESARDANLNVIIIQRLYPTSLILRINNGYVEASLPTSFRPVIIHDPALRAKYMPLESFDKVSAHSANSIYDCCVKVCLETKDENLFFNLLRQSSMSEDDMRDLTEKFGRPIAN